MRLNEIYNVYLLGIGGIGMSAIARYFSSLKKNVAGYDKTQTALTDELQKEGMKIHFEDNIELLPAHFRNKERTLIIYTPAIPQDHKELAFFVEYGYTIIKRSDALGMLTASTKNLAIAGTHGKTTTTTLTAHILKVAGYKFNAFMGGISKNYNSNILLNCDAEYSVIEADEYDRSFLKLSPHAAIITSIDADHLDIYGSFENVKEAFSDFTKLITQNGFVLVKKEADIHLNCNKLVKKYTYSINLEADFFIKNLQIENGLYQFDLVHPTGVIEDIELGVPGLFNVENSVAASAMALLCGVEADAIKTALKSFAGIQRRLDFRIRTDKLIYIDDYAHHPEEIKACINSVRKMFPDKMITGIFQPHLYSRTRDFADEFAESLSMLDELILLPIYPARELPIEGVDSEMLLFKVTCKKKQVCTKKDLFKVLDNKEINIILTVGAGDIDQLIEPLEKYLSNVNDN